jgi:hypothetical protein
MNGDLGGGGGGGREIHIEILIRKIILFEVLGRFLLANVSVD